MLEHVSIDDENEIVGAHITIVYCRLCNWMLRANWMAQELLSTFADEITEITLKPRMGGIFEIWIAREDQYDGEPQRLWSRKDDGGFPDIKVLKQKVRDVVAPDRSLGHVDGFEAESRHQ